ncbi:MAG: type II toxin-antitoxin system RatA family toxin [Bdellovibrionales bacterium]
MPTHAEKRILPYTAQQMFDLVADVEKYPEFLPWCADCKITHFEGNALPTHLTADLSVGFGFFKETFTSRVKLDHGVMRIDVEYLNGPFKHLNNHWIFVPKGKERCEIDFFIDFEFRSGMLQSAMTAFFNEAVRRMIAAFEARATAIYG